MKRKLKPRATLTLHNIARLSLAERDGLFSWMSRQMTMLLQQPESFADRYTARYLVSKPKPLRRKERY